MAAFDLDGTLVDSAPDLCHCLGDALDSVGLGRPGLSEATAWIGDGIEVLIRRGIEAALGRPPDSALADRCLSAFDRCYRDRLFRDSRLYPGVADALPALAATGLILGCVTNKREAYARELIAEAGIAGHLRFVIGGDTLAVTKPDPKPLLHAAARFDCRPNQAVMIGDSINDYEAASRAGFAFIYVSYGYSRIPAATLTGCAASVDAFSGLTRLLCGPTADK